MPPRATAGRALAGLVLGLAGAVLVAAPAVAHAVLVSVSPADGSTLAKAPAQVVLTFDENIRTPSKIVVHRPDGSRVDHGGTHVVDNKVSVAVVLRPVPQDVGRYTVAYRVVSADGHPVAGTRTFRYAPPGVRAAPVSSATDGTARASSRTVWVVGGCVAVVVIALVLMLPWLRRGRRS
jgi:methionine-rich copper-binding protein CopC